MKKKIITIALGSAALIMGGTAVAQQSGMMGGGDITRAEAQTKASERFAKMDANGDGQITPADREAKMRMRFDEADTSGNGELSFDEVTAQREARKATREERRAELGERRGERRGMRGHRGGGERMMERADTDQNGTISEAEFTTAAMTRFDRADANSDGTITSDERRAQHSERRGNRGERGQRGERGERAAPQG